MTGVGRILPVRADSSRDAALLAANQLVHGYFDRRKGSLHFEFSIEEVESHSMRAVAVDGDALQAAAAIARAVDPEAKLFSSSNAAAVEAWGRQNFEQATALDPDFGTAWRDLIQSKRATLAEASELAAKALARQGLRSPVERAQIALLAGQLDKDPAAIGKASSELLRLIPNDSAMLRRVAEEETTARNFGHAVELYQAFLKVEPGDALARNLLGYAQFFADDLAGARQSFDEYGQAPGQGPNALDSQGEVLFMAGQFADAEKYFLRAHEANPEMLQGADLEKAAYSRWLAGDLTGADAIFEKYIKYRSDRADQSLAWRRAGWEYATGRETQAMERLEREQGPAKNLAMAQLVFFKSRPRMYEGLSRDLDNLAETYRRTPPSADGFVRVLYAKALLMAGRKAEAAKLAALWPLPGSGQVNEQAMLFPLYLELKKDLAKP